jgi:hypothetical protein
MAAPRAAASPEHRDARVSLDRSGCEYRERYEGYGGPTGHSEHRESDFHALIPRGACDGPIPLRLR